MKVFMAGSMVPMGEWLGWVFVAGSAGDADLAVREDARDCADTRTDVVVASNIMTIAKAFFISSSYFKLVDLNYLFASGYAILIDGFDGKIIRFILIHQFIIIFISVLHHNTVV